MLQFSATGLCQFWHTMDVVPEKPEHPRKLVWLVDSLDRLAGLSAHGSAEARFRIVVSADRAEA